LVFERWICVAVPIMPHYVNIALGIIFWPCLFVRGSGRLFGFLLLPLKDLFN
jgi:hypothetical protein